MTIAIVGNGILLNSQSDKESRGEDVMDKGLHGDNEARLDGKESSDTKKHSNANKCSDDREHSDSQEGPDGDEHAGDKDPTDDDNHIGTENVDESDHGPQMDSVDHCGDPCLPGLVSAHPTPSHHHSTSLFPSQTILINPLSNPCIHLSGSFNPPVGLPRKLRPVLVLCPCHLGFAGESFSTLLS